MGVVSGNGVCVLGTRESEMGVDGEGPVQVQSWGAVLRGAMTWECQAAVTLTLSWGHWLERRGRVCTF